MTIKDLKNYYLLDGEIKNEEEKILRIEARLGGAVKYDTSGIPKNPTTTNRVEATYLELVTRKNELQKKVMEYKREKSEIEKYISEIDDMLIRRIVELRVLKNRSFREIANELGGNNTTDSVKKMYYRYIIKN